MPRKPKPDSSLAAIAAKAGFKIAEVTITSTQLDYLRALNNKRSPINPVHGGYKHAIAKNTRDRLTMMGLLTANGKLTAAGKLAVAASS